MENPVPSQPCQFLGLPDELKLEIVGYLDKRRDLYNLSRTCRALEDVTMTRLYHAVDFEVPCSGTCRLRQPLLQSVRDLTVRNGAPDKRRSGYARRRLSNVHSSDGYIVSLLDQLQANQLTQFGYFHRNTLSPRALETLVRQHNPSLESLRVYDSTQLDHVAQAASVPTNLTTFACHTTNSGEWASKVVASNRSTLHTLHLGQERQLLEEYQRTRIGFLDLIPQPQIPLLPLPANLRSLSLCGIALRPLLPTSEELVLPFTRLTHLSLQSCPDSAAFLDVLAQAFTWVATSPSAPQPNTPASLQHFSLRHENPTTPLREATQTFLASFTGLLSLSLLFENAAILDRPSSFLAPHRSLRSLALECRIQPREHLSLDTSRPPGAGAYSSDLWTQCIADVAACCPDLEALAMGFPWNDEIVRLRPSALPALPALRAIHIRNFPESHVLSQLGDYTIKEFASKFVEWVFPSLAGAARPSLEHLAVGPTLYESRYRMDDGFGGGASGALGADDKTRLRKQPPEFLRTHHYCLDWATTRFGRWSPMITAVSERYAEEMYGERPLGGIFDGVWLK